MAFCTNCGNKIEDNAKFCPSCGASVEERPQTPKASPASEPAPSAPASSEKVLAVLKGNYKIIGAAVLAVVVLVWLFSRCSGGGGGGKEGSFLDQIKGYWTMETQVYSDATQNINRKWNIGITENIINLGDEPRGPIDCPISETEYKDGALYFSAQWYQSTPVNGQDAGMTDFDLRLIYDKSSDLLTMEVRLDAGSTMFMGMELEYSAGWYPLAEYTRVD